MSGHGVWNKLEVRSGSGPAIYREHELVDDVVCVCMEMTVRYRSMVRVSIRT